MSPGGKRGVIRHGGALHEREPGAERLDLSREQAALAVPGEEEGAAREGPRRRSEARDPRAVRSCARPGRAKTPTRSLATVRSQGENASRPRQRSSGVRPPGWGPRKRPRGGSVALRRVCERLRGVRKPLCRVCERLRGVRKPLCRVCERLRGVRKPLRRVCERPRAAGSARRTPANARAVHKIALRRARRRAAPRSAVAALLQTFAGLRGAFLRCRGRARGPGRAFLRRRGRARGPERAFFRGRGRVRCPGWAAAAAGLVVSRLRAAPAGRRARSRCPTRSSPRCLLREPV
jgi:hypothetical protein